MKKCFKCEEYLGLSNFRKNKRSKDGLQGKCKDCAKKYDVVHREANKESIQRSWERHYQNNTDKVKGRAAKWEADNKDHVADRKKSYREKNKDIISIYHSKYRKENLLKLSAYNAIYRKNRIAKDEDFRFLVKVQQALHRIIRRKSDSKDRELGYSSQDLRKRIESQFKTGMTWDNHGEWHIDHIKPISLFISQGETRPVIINALRNLQPLWAKDNIAKGSKYEEKSFFDQ